MKPPSHSSSSQNTRSYSSFTQKEIKELFQTAHRVIRQPELTILLTDPKPTVGRFLIIIPRAVGGAVIRNHLRRQIKSIFREQKLYEYGSDCVIILRLGASTLTFSELQQLMLKAFSHVSRKGA